MSLLAIAPALPLHKAGPYVAAAYLVFLAIVLIYVGIMARRLVRNPRELAELKRDLLEREEKRQQSSVERPESAEGPEPEPRQVTTQL